MSCLTPYFPFRLLGVKVVERKFVKLVNYVPKAPREEQVRMNLYCLNAAGPNFPRVPDREVEAFVKFRREKLHELPWLKKYGFTQLLEESAWTWKHFSRKVAGAKNS